MKKSRFTEEQITFALRQAESGMPVADVCRQIGIAEATFYVWRKKYANLGVLELRELRQLRDKNARLKRVVAELTLDRHILQEVVQKNDLKPSRRREIAHWIHERFQVSKKRSCRLALLRRSTWYYQSTARDRSALRARISELAHSRPRFGYQRIHILLGRESRQAGRNQVYRLYRPGGPAGEDARAPAQADQPASGSGAGAHGREPVVEHGFCA